MIHPSYVELMNAVNKDCPQDDPVVKSRYSIVTATARRARQLIDHADSGVEDTEDRKPLSVAVEEINNGSVRILTDASAAALQEEMERSLLLANAADGTDGAEPAETETDEADDGEAAEAETDEADDGEAAEAETDEADDVKAAETDAGEEDAEEAADGE